MIIDSFISIDSEIKLNNNNQIESDSNDHN